MSPALSVQDGCLPSTSAGVGEELEEGEAALSLSAGLLRVAHLGFPTAWWVVSGKSEFMQQPAFPRTRDVIGSYQVLTI